MRLASLLGPLALAAAACSSASDGGSQHSPASGGGDGSFSPAAHAPFPSVTYQGGPLVTAPKIVTITFPGDALVDSLEAFGKEVASSSWWDAVRADLCAPNGGPCVGDGPAGTSARLTQNAPASFTDSAQGGASSLQTFLSGLITSGAVPQPDAGTIYVLYVPKTTKVTLDGEASCVAFDGYHNAMKVGQTPVYYAVVPECTPTESVSLAEYTTATAAHEIIEVASDPGDQAAFYLDVKDPASWGWDDVEGGELADLCVDALLLGQDLVKDGGFTFQRVWSPKRAAAGQNPCVPVGDGEVYFNAAPSVPVVAVDVGKSTTIDVVAFSDAPMDPWTLTAEDWTDPNTTYVFFAIEGGKNSTQGPQIDVSNGTTVKLTVTLKADPGKTTNGEADAALVSTVGDVMHASKGHYWPFVVMTTAEAKAAGALSAQRIARPIHRTKRKTRPRFAR